LVIIQTQCRRVLRKSLFFLIPTGETLRRSQKKVFYYDCKRSCLGAAFNLVTNLYCRFQYSTPSELLVCFTYPGCTPGLRILSPMGFCSIQSSGYSNNRLFRHAFIYSSIQLFSYLSIQHSGIHSIFSIDHVNMQRLPLSSCQPKNPPLMLRLLICLFMAFALLAIACSKNDSGNESLLYGTWIKGSQTGDTLWFLRKDGKNIIRSNQSFNPGLTMYKDEEYAFKNGKLSRVLAPVSSAFSHIDSFTWKQEGKEFEVLGYQLFLFMSSTLTKFTYTKVD